MVDDNRINTALYQRVIADIPETSAVCFTNPLNALAHCRAELPALAVVDYRMAAIDGLEFMRRFRHIPGAADIPLVMLTSVSSPVLWQMALDAGANAFLIKPIEKKQFHACVLKLLESVPSQGRV